VLTPEWYDHNLLCSSERQYKRRIAHWNLDNKNIRDGDMKFVLGKRFKRRQEDGKETDFKINGRPVPHQKMQRFIQRKRLSEGEVGLSQAGL
jgi:hypothetical protein